MRMRPAFSVSLGLLSAAAIVALPAAARASDDATAQLNAQSLGGGEFQDDITVTNTGTSPLGSFWYSWLPENPGSDGIGYLTALPTSITAPPGWTEVIRPASSPYAIEWVNSTGSNIAASSAMGGFNFQTTESPASLNNAPVDYAYVYQGTPQEAPDPGGAFLQVSVVTPEPASISMLGMGLAGLLVRRRR